MHPHTEGTKRGPCPLGRRSKYALEVGNALKGLRSLADCVETRALAAAFAPHVARCEQGLDAQAIGNAVSRLQSLADCASFVQTGTHRATKHVPP